MIGAIAGAVFGVGVLLAWSAVGVRARLDSVWEPKRKEMVFDIAGERVPEWHSWVDRGIDRAGVDGVLEDTGLTAALSVAGRTRAEFVAETAAKALAVMVAVIVVGGRASNGVGVQIVAMAFGLALMVMLVEVRSLHRLVEKRRTDMLHAVAAFIEFTRLAAQTQSIEASMRAAASIGATWPFRVLERVFAQADAQRDAPWAGMIALGKQFAMPEIIELGSALAGAGREGGRVNDMLMAKSVSLRRRLTEAEVAEAESRTQQIGVPLGGLGVVAMTLLIAPAMLAL